MVSMEITIQMGEEELAESLGFDTINWLLWCAMSKQKAKDRAHLVNKLHVKLYGPGILGNTPLEI